jgi:hypothetical protein
LAVSAAFCNSSILASDLPPNIPSAVNPFCNYHFLTSSIELKPNCLALPSQCFSLKALGVGTTGSFLTIGAMAGRLLLIALYN